MISFIQKNLYTYFAIYIVNIIEYRFISLMIAVLHDDEYCFSLRGEENAGSNGP